MGITTTENYQAFERLGTRLRRHIDSSLQQIGLSTRLLQVLEAVADRPLSQRQIAEKVGISANRVVAVVDELQELRLVQRRVDPTCRRKNRICLLDEGKRKIEEARVYVNQS